MFTMYSESEIEHIAKICHEANRAHCENTGDFSQSKWEDAPEWQRESAINGVKYHIENPHCEPSQSHENWYKVKEEQGWKYGPVKDVEKKEHPCFVPYKELPVNQRVKDYIFGSIVRSFDYFKVENRI